jgi:hypothetical protein
MRFASLFLFAFIAFFATSSAPLNATTLLLDVFQPKPVITSADPIQFRARTSEDVFARTSHAISSSFAVNGFDVAWSILSQPTGAIGNDMVLPLGHSKTLPALPAGQYRLLANWMHVGGGIIQGAPRTGDGVLEFEVIPQPIYAGDFNDDGFVDGADFLLWQQQAGATGEMAADGNADLIVDALDLELWKADVTQLANSTAAASAVPEPSAAAMFGCAWLLFAQQKKRLSQRLNKQEMGRRDRAAS